MAARPTELFCISRTNKYSLLMEQPGRINDNEHVIDIRRSIEVASSSSVHDRVSDELGPSNIVDRPSSSDRASISHLPLPLSNISNSSNSSGRRSNTHTRRRRSPLNSQLWIFIELALTLGQIAASVIVLALSGHEHPHTPLFAWIVGYAAGCVATLPLLYWRYLRSNQLEEQDSIQTRQSSSNGNLTAEHSLSRTAQMQEDDNRIPSSANRSAGGLSVLIHNARLKASAEYFKMGVDCFFAIWFVVGNVWIFGGRASSSDAPNLYRLCVVFLILSCIGYAMPFILCVMMCCCLPCIISVLGVREGLNQTRGATTESINLLPIYKFKLKKSRISEGAAEAGLVAAGTANERVISGEDAVCCICLANYANNDELRELPCSHLLHKDCVDKWLKINALCPLCKTEVGDTLPSSLAEATTGLRRAESRVGSF